MYNFRTDLALERRDIYQKVNNLKQIDGIKSTEEEINEKLKVTRVEILNKNGEKAIGKPVGNYVTIDVKKLKLAEDEDIQKASEVVTKELKKIINIHTDKQGDILVVGLGNIYVTPDALGPKTAKMINATKHLNKKSKKNVAVIYPNVMSKTGMETSDIVKAIVDKEQIDLVIAIDSLATRKIDRLNKVIQITDTGISPGAGIGNYRKRMVQEYLKVPVIAIGVATVVDSYSLLYEYFDKTNLSKIEKKKISKEIKSLEVPNLYLTPKEIDLELNELSKVISKILNKILN